MDGEHVLRLATSPTPWLTSTPRQSSTASPASIPSEQRRSTGARMASGRLFIATEVRYRNACHDWRCPGFALELNGVMQDCTADAIEATTREDASARTRRNRVRTHRDPRDHPVDRSDLLLLASRVAGSPALMPENGAAGSDPRNWRLIGRAHRDLVSPGMTRNDIGNCSLVCRFGVPPR